MECFDTRDQLIAEFRRASRYVLKASHAVFFLHEPDGFRADRGTSFVPANDPLVAYFQNHPTVIDGTIWESHADPVAELAVRNYLAMWGAACSCRSTTTAGCSGSSPSGCETMADPMTKPIAPGRFPLRVSCGISWPSPWR